VCLQAQDFTNAVASLISQLSRIDVRHEGEKQSKVYSTLGIEGFPNRVLLQKAEYLQLLE
jgi:hypothetical protein